jgi:hypothetical protein
MTNKPLETFGKLATTAFKEPLANHGFRFESVKTEAYSCEVVFVNAARYIKIAANSHPRDAPPSFNVVLGEGGRDFFESDWNSVALWRLKNLMLQSEAGSEYRLGSLESTPALIELALADLLEFGAGFLNGDLEAFRKTRSIQNTSRTPYQIYAHDNDGRYYVASDEPESAKMKEKYS